jgi:hypothetical protein
VLISRGDLARAGPLVDEALHDGPPLAGYEARRGAVHPAVAMARGDARAIVHDARSRALAGGHLASARDLSDLLELLAR